MQCVCEFDVLDVPGEENSMVNALCVHYYYNHSSEEIEPTYCITSTHRRTGSKFESLLHIIENKVCVCEFDMLDVLGEENRW